MAFLHPVFAISTHSAWQKIRQRKSKCHSSDSDGGLCDPNATAVKVFFVAEKKYKD